MTLDFNGGEPEDYDCLCLCDDCDDCDLCCNDTQTEHCSFFNCECDECTDYSGLEDYWEPGYCFDAETQMNLAECTLCETEKGMYVVEHYELVEFLENETCTDRWPAIRLEMPGGGLAIAVERINDN
jgi:hypothetical protein